MKNLYFLDVETTSLDMEADITQLSMYNKNITLNDYFLTDKEIWIEAMEKTGIDKEFLEKNAKTSFKDSDTLNILKDIFSNEDNIIVCHNADFDLWQLYKYWLTPKHYICSLKSAKNVFPEMESFRLWYLRYYFNDISKNLILQLQNNLKIEKIEAHDSMSDVIILYAVFTILYKNLQERWLNWEDIYKKMIKYTNEPILLSKIRFWKHKGKSFEELVNNSDWYQYLEWLLKDNEKKKNDWEQVDEDLLYTVKYHLWK